MKTIKSQILKRHCIPNRINTKKISPGPIIVKLLKINAEEKLLKAAREKRELFTEEQIKESFVIRNYVRRKTVE